MTMPWDETLIKDAEKDFRQEGERAATRLAISFLMAQEARRDPMFLTEVCERFEKEIAELGFSYDLEDMDRMLVMARRYFQLMVTTAEILAKEAEQATAQRSPSEGPRDHRTE
jgi:hypothetical protein